MPLTLCACLSLLPLWCVRASLCLPSQLAQKRWGVIGIQWRDAPCWYKPRKAARVPKWIKPTPQPWWEKAPQAWNEAMDRRINNRFRYQIGR
jgi:hypothetical protein